ncbi:hypothetical protein ABZX92_40500 [Lentzea sp. NPDC006480]
MSDKQDELKSAANTSSDLELNETELNEVAGGVRGPITRPVEPPK